MNQDDLETMLSEILRQEIDRTMVEEISIKSYLDRGWHLVSIDQPDLNDIGQWMQEFIHCGWRGYRDRWVFESEQDAVIFKLRWG